MKTATEILENEWNKNKNNCPFNEIYIGEKIAMNNAMIEFAKMHVQGALKQASVEAEVEHELSNPYDPNSEYQIVNKDSILNAYPLDLIK